MNEIKLRILKLIVPGKKFPFSLNPRGVTGDKYMVHLFTKITFWRRTAFLNRTVVIRDNYSIIIMSVWRIWGLLPAYNSESKVRDFDRDKWSLWLIGVLWETLPLHSTPAQLWNWNTEILWNRNTHETRNTHDWDFLVPLQVMNITLFETKTLFTRTLSLESVTSSFLIYEVNLNYFILWNVDMRRSSFCIPCFDLSMRKRFGLNFFKSSQKCTYFHEETDDTLPNR